MPSTSINPFTISEYKALVENIPTYCPKAVWTVSGQSFTAAQAVKLYQGLLDAASAVSTAKTGWVDSRKAETAVVTQSGTIAAELRVVIAAMFANNTTALAALEIAPKKARQPLSTDALAAKKAKMAATRIARGTTSKKQKAAVTGNVIGVTITPITIPSATPTAPAATSVVQTPAAPAATPTTPAPAATTTPAMAAVVVAPVSTPTTVATPAAPIPVTPVVSNGAAPALAVATHP